MGVEHRWERGMGVERLVRGKDGGGRAFGDRAIDSGGGRDNDDIVSGPYGGRENG